MAQQWRTATAAYAVFFLFLALLVWQGIRDWSVVAAGYACITAIIIIGRSPLSRRRLSAPVALALNAAFMVLFTRLYGPIFVVSGVLAVETFAWMAYPPFVDRPWTPMLVMAATLVVPLALERLGVLAPTWWVHDDEIVTTSAALDITPGRDADRARAGRARDRRGRRRVLARAREGPPRCAARAGDPDLESAASPAELTWASARRVSVTPCLRRRRNSCAGAG